MVEPGWAVLIREYRRPWKLATLALGLGFLIGGSVLWPAPDWDIGVSVIMAVLAYLTAAWSLRVLVQRRWKALPLALFWGWLTVDGCYSLYWAIRNPDALQWMRDANWLASLWLYLACGLVWYFPGSLRELWAEIATRRSVRNLDRRPDVLQVGDNGKGHDHQQ